MGRAWDGTRLGRGQGGAGGRLAFPHALTLPVSASITERVANPKQWPQPICPVPSQYEHFSRSFTCTHRAGQLIGMDGD